MAIGSKLGENKAPKKKPLPPMNGDLRSGRDLDPYRGGRDLQPLSGGPAGALPPLGGAGALAPLGGDGRLAPVNDDEDIGKGIGTKSINCYLLTGWPRHREKREFGCQLLHTGKTQGI